MDPNVYIPLGLAVLVVWLIYRRLRRNFGRQPVQERRLYARAVVLMLLSVLMVVSAATDMRLMGALLAGIAAGALLGYFGLRHTKYETTDGARYYTPHTYIGLVVTALLFGRIAYRVAQQYPGMHAAMRADEDPFASFQRSPLTLAIFGVLVGYYVVYNIGVVRRSRALAAGTPQSQG